MALLWSRGCLTHPLELPLLPSLPKRQPIVYTLIKTSMVCGSTRWRGSAGLWHLPHGGRSRRRLQPPPNANPEPGTLKSFEQVLRRLPHTGFLGVGVLCITEGRCLQAPTRLPLDRGPGGRLTLNPKKVKFWVVRGGRQCDKTVGPPHHSMERGPHRGTAGNPKP